jgi:hypothetical protein
MNTATFLNTDFATHLAALTDAHTPLWGKMNAQQMVEHLGQLFIISNGKFAVPPLTAAPEAIVAAHHRFFVENQPFPKNFRVAALGSEPAPVRFADLATAKAKLLTEKQRFDEFFAQNPTAKPLHPLFGALTHSEWAIFHTRHISHHFAQFGLIE